MSPYAYRECNSCSIRSASISLLRIIFGQESSEACASRLAERFPRHFGEDVVNHAQLARLISKMQRSTTEWNSKTMFSPETCNDPIYPIVATTTSSSPTAAENTNNEQEGMVLKEVETEVGGNNVRALPAGKAGSSVKVRRRPSDDAGKITVSTTTPSVSGQWRI